MIASPQTAAEDRRLSEDEARTLRAMVCRVLPSGDGLGAAEAGCPDYVVHAVETRMGPAYRGRMRRGLGFLDGIARETCGRGFADAGEADQDAALRQLQLTPHPTLQDFLHRIVNLSLEAFLGDPRHGGNRGRTGWRYLELTLGLTHDGAPRRGGGGGCTTF